MCDGRVHRFDRRPEQPTDGRELGHNQMDLLRNDPVRSEDTYVPDVDTTFVGEIAQLSYCEIELFLDGQVDLLAILSACYAISADEEARRYTLLRHNCFFFSWTILMVATRHYLPYGIPKYLPLLARLESYIHPLTSFTVDETIKLFVDLVLDTALVFRRKVDPALRGGLLAVGSKLLRFLWRRYSAVRLQLGFRKQLAVAVERQIRERMARVYENIIANYTKSESLDSNLWIEDAKAGLENEIRNEVAKILWDTLLEVISSSVGETVEQELEEQSEDYKLKFSVLGKRSAQFFAVLNIGLLTGMQAAKRAAQGHNGALTDETIFNRAWDAARDAAITPAQILVAKTNAQVKDPTRVRMWKQIWEIWDDAWDESRVVVQPRSLEMVKNVADELVRTCGGAIIQEVKGSRDRLIEARVSEVIVLSAL